MILFLLGTLYDFWLKGCSEVLSPFSPHCDSREGGHGVSAFPVHPPYGEEHQEAWGQQGLGGTCRPASDNTDGNKYIVVSVHQISTVLSAAERRAGRIEIKVDFGLSHEPEAVN